MLSWVSTRHASSNEHDRSLGAAWICVVKVMLDVRVAIRNSCAVSSVAGIEAELHFPLIGNTVIILVRQLGQGAIVGPALLRWQVELCIKDPALAFPNRSRDPQIDGIPGWQGRARV